MYYAERRRRARSGDGSGRKRARARAPPARVRPRLKLIEDEEEWDSESFGSLSTSELESMLDHDGEFELYDEDDPVHHSPVERRKAGHS